MIVAYEPFSTNLNHVPVNSEFLSILATSFPNSRIMFYGEKTHLEHVRMNVKSSNVVYKAIKVIEPAQGKIRAVMNEKKNVQFISSMNDEEI